MLQGKGLVVLTNGTYSYFDGKGFSKCGGNVEAAIERIGVPTRNKPDKFVGVIFLTPSECRSHGLTSAQISELCHFPPSVIDTCNVSTSNGNGLSTTSNDRFPVNVDSGSPFAPKAPAKPAPTQVTDKATNAAVDALLRKWGSKAVVDAVKAIPVNNWTEHLVGQADAWLGRRANADMLRRDAEGKQCAVQAYADELGPTYFIFGVPTKRHHDERRGLLVEHSFDLRPRAW